MIDLHSHVLPFVDDGSDSLEKSVEMLKNCQEMGVTDLVLTPHFRGRFNKTAIELKTIFEQFKEQVKQHGVNLNLYLGQEIYWCKEFKTNLSNGTVFGINQGKYLLVECPYGEECDVTEIVYEVKTTGYIPVVAHVERYSYITVDDVEEIKRMGAVVQVNAGSIVAKDNRIDRKKVKKLFKLGLVDVVASDVHAHRQNYMQRAYEVVQKKYGKDTADAVFIHNAKKIIQG
ncbi:MAG: hypothetical protein IKB98_09165 [Clostridia bacterium]|nr:hypothetical protein [Clostridia bacterium]